MFMTVESGLYRFRNLKRKLDSKSELFANDADQRFRGKRIDRQGAISVNGSDGSAGSNRWRFAF